MIYVYSNNTMYDADILFSQLRSIAFAYVFSIFILAHMRNRLKKFLFENTVIIPYRFVKLILYSSSQTTNCKAYSLYEIRERKKRKTIASFFFLFYPSKI